MALRASSPGALLGLVALPAVLIALASSEPLPHPSQLKAEGFWRSGCPVGLSDLRLLTVSHWGFDWRSHTGQLVVNAAAAGRLGRAFGRLYGLHCPIRHMRLADMYGPRLGRPRDGDVTAAFGSIGRG